MGLPAAYSWLSKESGPKILLEALKLYGTLEVPGVASNPEILKWAKEVGYTKLAFQYVSDEVPWCGLFLAICATRAGFEIPGVPLRALSWAGFGKEIKKESAMLGDVLTFTRKGGGHVGLYVGEDAKAFHVLGGNQGDSVSITRIAKERLYGVSRCKWKVSQPNNVRKVWLSDKGVLSENEA